VVAPGRRPIAVTVTAPEGSVTVAVPRAAPQHPGGPASGRVQVAPPVTLVDLNFMPVLAPLPDVARHLVQPPGTAALGIVPHSRGGFLAPVLMPATVPAILPIIPPGVLPAVHSPGSFLPLQLRGDAQARPLTIGPGIVPTDADHRMVRLFRGK
jgi:hypothetical protein